MLPNSKGNSLSGSVKYTGWEKFSIFDWNRRLARKWFKIAQGCNGTLIEVIGVGSIRAGSDDLERLWKAGREGSIYFALNFYRLTYNKQIWQDSTRMHGEGRISRCQPRPSSHEGGPKRSQFWSFPVFVPIYPLTQHFQIRRGGGQPRHCICTNASRGLSATAEFLVNNWFYILHN